MASKQAGKQATEEEKHDLGCYKNLETMSTPPATQHIRNPKLNINNLSCIYLNIYFILCVV